MFYSLLSSLLPVLLLLSEISFASCKYKFIHNASELIEFSNDVNNGTTYEGYTVFLVADIKFDKTLSQQFEPIGKNAEKYFTGFFDGQGHTISDLSLVSSSLKDVGLFGYSKGTTIKNVVFDNSCSVLSTYSSGSSNIRVGGIIAKCEPLSGQCIIENSVNMASVTFTGSAKEAIFLGGIAGKYHITSNTFTTKIVNCANYGTISNPGKSGDHVNLGGITGKIYTTVSNFKCFIYNCINYGTVKNTGSATSYYIGGIVGISEGITVENCVSTGAVSSSEEGSVGGIIGEAWAYSTTLTQCYWTDDTGCTYYYGKTSSYLIYQNSDKVVLSSNYANNLNTYANNNNWNGWVFNKNSAKISFAMYDKNTFSFSSQLILVPEPVRRGYSFMFWCVDDDSIDKCNNMYDSSTTTIFTKETILYAQWIVNNCTITLDVNGGKTFSSSTLTTTYDQKYGESLLTPTRSGYTFVGWFTVYDDLVTKESLVNSACNCSLQARWTPSKYTITFDENGGDTISEKTKEATYDDTYRDLPEPTKTGYSFDGWFTNVVGGKKVESGDKVINFNNHVLYAHWSINNYTIFFDTKGGVPVDSIKAQYLSTVEIQSTSSKEYCTFLFWKTKDNVEISGTFTVPAKNTTLYAVWLCTHISSAEELIEFSNNVNDLGMNYSGTTVYIDSDIEFTDELSKEFRPIGEELSSLFLGIFDGQGHTISSLTANSSSFQYSGVFGYSLGTIIRNIVVDDSCSFKSSYYNISSSCFLAGIIGDCYADGNQCTIENSVNMASIEFNGRIGINMFLGGIVGQLYHVDYYSLVRNCANYGSLTHSGTVDRYKFIGGIIGECYKGYVQNCANYGPFTQEEKSSNTIGGIVGKTWFVSIENCLSVGKITSSGTSGPIGSIVGNGLNSSTVITNCFWTSDTKYNKAYGTGSPKVTGSTQKTINIGLVNTLNTRSASNSWNSWLLNMNGVSVSFKINDYRGFSVKPKVILLPNPADNDERLFDGWYKDPALISLFTDSQVDLATTLYGTFCTLKYTVTLNVTSGEEIKTNVATIRCNGTYGDLPEPEKEGYTFSGWYTESEGGGNKIEPGDKVTNLNNHTLYAHWTVNNYTITFNFGNGTEIERNVTYGDKYGELPEPEKKGYTFVGWFTEKDGKGDEIKSENEVDIIDDTNIYAEWMANNYTIIFNTNGGDELSNITASFDGNYSCLPVPRREGYTFLWWYIEGTNIRVDNETKVEIACNHTLCAAWDKNTVIFDVNGGEELGNDEKEKEVTYDDTYKTLPTPTKNGYTFDGWYTEEGEQITNDTKVEIVSDQTIHAKWTPNNYTMTLDVNGGDALSDSERNITVAYDGTYGYIPEPSRTGYRFIGWYTENNELVTSESKVTDACHCTLRANWTANTYFIIFEVNGGNELDEDERNITVTYNSTYGRLPAPTREGYEFVGWFTEDDEEITNTAKVNIINNQTLHARWTEVILSQTITPTRYVEVVIGKGNMNEEEIKEVIGKFTKEHFDIVSADFSKSGETTVIIRFNDAENAEGFLIALNESSDGAKNFIRYAHFNSGVDKSLSVLIYPLMKFNIILV